MLVITALLSLCSSAPLQAQEPLAFERVVESSAGLHEATDIRSLPGGDTLFVSEKRGKIKLVRGGAVLSAPFVDMGPYIDTGGNVGLRSFAFHPGYQSNGFVFLWYDAPNGTTGVDGVLCRVTRSQSNTDRLDLSTMQEILRVPQDGRTHGGGALQFDGQGMLMLGIGDGSEGGDPYCRAQDRTNLLGSIIRIDVDGAAPYEIPSDNPFIGVPGVRPEIFHYGLRHPWKWSIDPTNGATYIADVGNFEREEIDYVPPGVSGLNFGWSVVEGTLCFAGNTCVASLPPCGDPVYADPVWEYDHTVGCSITGGDVYFGDDIAALQGRYVVSDFCSNKIYSIRVDPVTGARNVKEHPITYYPGSGALHLNSTFGVDPNGELLIFDYADGEIWRLAPHASVGSVCQGAVNGTGVPAVLSTQGSTSVAANDLVFHVAHAPPFALGVLFYGPEPTYFPWANGVRCVDGPTLLRVNFGVATPNGELTHVVNLDVDPFTRAIGHVDPGSTWYFQAWYRDPANPIGQGTNFSSALAIRFRP